MISIKRAITTDAAVIAITGKLSFIESHGHSASRKDIESYVSETFTTALLETELANLQNIFHIIYVNGKAAGFSKIIFDHSYPLINETPVTKLEKLYVLKEFYDQKLGLKLFDFNVNLSKHEKQWGMWLYVWTENERALKFYKRSGFEVIDDTYFKISPTHSNPNYIMYLKY